MKRWLSAFSCCVWSDLLKLKRTHALVLPVFLSAAPPMVFFVYALQRGTVELPEEITPAGWTIQGMLSIWAVFLLPVLAAVEGSLITGIEHDSNGFKHMLALPLPRSAIFASKFAIAFGLMGLAHASLFAYTLAAVWALIAVRGPSELGPSLLAPEAATLVVLVGLGAAFLIGIHTLVALRWRGFAPNVGLALGGLLIGALFVESELRNVYPWSLPSSVQNMATPLVFGLDGRARPVHVGLVVGVSVAACLAVVVAGTAWLSRRDSP